MQEKIANIFEKIILVTRIFFRFLPTVLMIIILLVFFGAFLSLFDVTSNISTPQKEIIEFHKGSPEVAIIDLKGMIANDYGTYGLDNTSSDLFLKLLEAIKKDQNIAGVIIRTNSPGGTAVDSDIIAQKVKELKFHKKIVAYIEDTGASGAYLIASQAHKIIAHPQSITGSIGARIDLPIIKELTDKIGIKVISIKSGPYKNSLSPFKELNTQEEKILQNLVNESYESFIGNVAEGRKLSLAEVRSLADGRIYSGNQAKQLKLVDEVGNFNDAKNEIEKLIGISPLTFSKYFYRISPLDRILSLSLQKFNLVQNSILIHSKKLLYLWQ